MYGIYLILNYSKKEKRNLIEIANKSINSSKVYTNTSNKVAAFAKIPNYIGKNAYHEEANGDWLLIDGIVLDASNYKKLNAATLYKQIKINRENYLRKLNGEYLIVSSISNNVIIISDRMAQRQHCVVEKGKMLSIAPYPGAALRLIDKSKKINENALFTFISTNKMRHGLSTIWENCSVLDKASEYKIAPDGKIIFNKYWDLQYQPNYDYGFEEIVQSSSELFCKAVKARLNKNAKVGMTLTGGLDSRLMVGSVPEQLRSNIVCSSMGLKGCDEIEIARKVSKIAGYKYREINIDSHTSFSNENENYLIDEDIDLITQNCWMSYLANNSDCDLIFHGLDLDVTLGGDYLTDELKNICNTKNGLIDYALQNILSTSFENISKLFKNDFFINKVEQLRNEIEITMQNVKQKNPLNTYDNFILQNSMHRVILGRYRTTRKFIDTVSPMYDLHLIELYLKIPPELRMQHKLFRSVLINICPELTSLPYQRTGLPPSIPIKFWQEGRKLESAREKLYRNIALDTQGKIHLPYLRYFSNVDEWLRFDKTWKAAINKLLQSKTSIMRSNYLNAKFLDKLILEHQGHKKSHMKILHILLSAEIFLRRSRGEDMIELFAELS